MQGSGTGKGGPGGSGSGFLPLLPRLRADVPKAPGQAAGTIPNPLKHAVAVPPTGELSLELTGKDLASGKIKVYIVYQKYPKKLHNQPMSIEESRNVDYLTPKMVLTTPQTLAAILATAGDGFYEFKAAAQTESPVRAEFSLAFNRPDIAKKKRAIGARVVGKDTTIVKIMMPEGIIWDDNDAFDGNIEDSQSVTKYKSDGVVWKQYK